MNPESFPLNPEKGEKGKAMSNDRIRKARIEGDVPFLRAAGRKGGLKTGGRRSEEAAADRYYQEKYRSAEIEIDPSHQRRDNELEDA